MDMFSALADPNRRDIIELLSLKGRLPASKIYDNFDVTPPAISQHLKILKEADLVVVEKKAQQRIYSVNPAKVEELDLWIKKLKQQWEARFDRLDKVLEAEKRKLKKHGR
jgi:DNA-binding transcriptional ArsR family regulator